MSGLGVRHVLDVDDLSAVEIRRVLDDAARWKEPGASVPQLLGGGSVAAIYEKPSARTRVSFEVAVASLGGHPVTLQREEVGMGTRESAADVARTLSRYCSLIAARVHDHGTLVEMARVASVPIVNLLSDRSHPCQALADMLTIREVLGGTEGRRLAFVGDGNNVARSLAVAAALTGLECTVASPPGYELDDVTVDRVRNLGGVVELVGDPYEAVGGADVVYTDVWTSMGQEAEAAARRAAFEPFRVTTGLMEAAGPDAIFLHCLPAHRGDEVVDAVIDGPSSRVWDQAENRLHTARALVAFLVGSGAEGGH